MSMKTLLAGLCVAAAIAVLSTAANAITVTTNGPIQNGTINIDANDVYTMEIGGDLVDNGGSASFGFTALTDLVSIETNSLNPTNGFLGAVVTWSTGINGTGTVLGSISGAALAAGNELVLALMQGTTYWLTATWTDVNRNGSNFDLRVETSPVPVPAALPLLASGLLGMGYLARRRKASRA